MNVYRLRIRGLDCERARAAVRWQLFLFSDVRDVLRTVWPDVVSVLHDGDPDPEAWCAALAAAGYRSEPLGSSEAPTAA